MNSLHGHYRGPLKGFGIFTWSIPIYLDERNLFLYRLFTFWNLFSSVR